MNELYIINVGCIRIITSVFRSDVPNFISAGYNIILYKTTG